MITFDDLFAYRLYYQDMSTDEYFIIKKLKIILINDQEIDNNNVNQYLFDFYQHFGFSITLQEIESININQIPSPAQNLNNFWHSFVNLTNDQFSNIINNLHPINEVNEEPNNSPEYSDVSNSPGDTTDEDIPDLEGPEEDIPELEDLPIPLEDIPLPQLEGTIPELEEVPIDENISEILNETFHAAPPSLGEGQYTSPFSLLNLPTIVNNLGNLNNTTTHPPLNTHIPPATPIFPNAQFDIVFNNNTTIPINGHQNLFSQLFNNIINTNQPPLQEDVIMTLDKNDLNKLNILKYGEGDDSCSICMCDFEKEDEYYSLNCKHLFHKDCMDKWLKDYNYICPVCRCEIGKSKPKQDIEINPDDMAEATDI